jgi:hypothetical protein
MTYTTLALDKFDLKPLALTGGLITLPWRIFEPKKQEDKGHCK